MNDPATSTDQPPSPVGLVEVALADGNTLDRRVRSIAEAARSAAIEADVLERDGGLDGDLTIRLIEASHALHRAASVLGDRHPPSRPAGGHSNGFDPWYASLAGDERSEGPPEARADDRVRRLALRDRDTVELFQTIVQRVSEAGLLLEDARSSARDPDAGAQIEQALELLDHTVGEIRVVVFDRETRSD